MMKEKVQLMTISNVRPWRGQVGVLVVLKVIEKYGEDGEGTIT